MEAAVSFSEQVFLKISQISQVFSCEICEMFKITFFYKSPPVAASWPSYCCIGRRISLRYQLELVWLNWLTFIYTCWISVFYPAILHLKVTEAAPLVFYKKAFRNIHWEAPVLLIKNETY